MRALFLLTIVSAMALPLLTAQAGSRSSANYSISADSVDAAGAVVSSANYSFKGSACGEFGSGANAIATSAAYMAKSGFVGQLYDLANGIFLSAAPSTINEGGTRQLAAARLLDDGTGLALDPSTITWSILSGPITSISSGGVATADIVYQDTAANVQGVLSTFTASLGLTVLNVNNDNFGAYANDQIDDSWQVQYFGQPPNPIAGPNADPDGDGQSNLFEFTAGLIPTDPTSRFLLSVQPVNGQPSRKNIIFNPLVSGRTYTVQFTITLPNSNSWATLTGTAQSDNGNTRTVTDLNATGPLKFYRVQITRP